MVWTVGSRGSRSQFSSSSDLLFIDVYRRLLVDIQVILHPATVFWTTFNQEVTYSLEHGCHIFIPYNSQVAIGLFYVIIIYIVNTAIIRKPSKLKDYDHEIARNRLPESTSDKYVSIIDQFTACARHCTTAEDLQVTYNLKCYENKPKQGPEVIRYSTIIFNFGPRGVARARKGPGRPWRLWPRFPSSPGCQI